MGKTYYNFKQRESLQLQCFFFWGVPSLPSTIGGLALDSGDSGCFLLKKEIFEKFKNFCGTIKSSKKDSIKLVSPITSKGWKDLNHFSPKSLSFSSQKKKSTLIEAIEKKTYGRLIGALRICDCDVTTGNVGRATGWSRDGVVVTGEVTEGVTTVWDSECSSEPPVKSSCVAGFFAGKQDSSDTPSFFGGKSPPPPPPSPIWKFSNLKTFQGTQKRISFSIFPRPRSYHKLAQREKTQIRIPRQSAKKKKRKRTDSAAVKSSDETLNFDKGISFERERDGRN